MDKDKEDMKFADLVLLRKKYVNYIFELCFHYFETPRSFTEEELTLKKHMDYDWMLQGQATKITVQSNLLNQRIREFSKIAQVDKKAMNELMNLKITLKNQKKQIEELQEKHYKEILHEYEKILIFLSTKVLDKIKAENILQKMQKAIKKTEMPFVKHSENWKKDKKQYHDDIAKQSNFIIAQCEQILKDIGVTLTFDGNDFIYKQKNSHLIALQNSKVTSNCNNLAHYVDNFKALYPETLEYNDSEFYNLNLRDHFKEFSNLGISGIKENPKLKEYLATANEHIRKTQEIFYGISTTNRDFLIKLDIERKKLKKIALTEHELTEKTIKQWLEMDPGGVFFLFSEYLKNHHLIGDFLD